MSAFTQLDYLDLDDQFSEEELMVRDSVRGWVSERFLPSVMEHFEAGTFPMELVPELADLGVFGPTTPEEYGGAGLNGVSYGLICQELERGDSGLRSFVSVQGSLVMYPIFDLRQRRAEAKSGSPSWRPGRGDRMLRSHRARLRIQPRRDADHGQEAMGTTTILNGRKMWITNGTHLPGGHRLGQGPTTAKSAASSFPRDSEPGFSAPEQKHKWSLRASIHLASWCSRTCACRPRRPCCPSAKGLRGPAVLPDPGPLRNRLGRRRRSPGSCLRRGPQLLRRSASSFDKPLAGFQLAQKKLADMATDITCGSLLALRLGRLKDEGRMTPAQVSMAKRNNVALALETARTCRDMLGANGVTLEYQVGRHMLNLESVVTYEGTHDIHTLAIGAEVTGIQAYR